MPRSPSPARGILRLAYGPSNALAALVQLGDAPTPALSSAFRAAVRSERARLRKPLATLEVCIEWLAERGALQLERVPRRRRAEAPPLYARAGAIELDPAKLARGLAQEGDATDGRWHITAAALASVLFALRQPSLLELREARLGARAVTLDEATRALEGALESVGFVLRSTPRAKARAPAAPPAAKPPSVKTARAKAPDAKPPRAEPAAAKPRKKPPRTAGFGGLPDDAQPENRTAPPATPLGPRGVSLDAEYFLEQAEIAAWPCARRELDLGRRRALARLHPDRRGDAATGLFQRATRGYAELVERLAAPTPHAAPTPSQPPPPPPRPSMGEWPPRPQAPRASSPRAAASKPAAPKPAAPSPRKPRAHAAV